MDCYVARYMILDQAALSSVLNRACLVSEALESRGFRQMMGDVRRVLGRNIDIENPKDPLDTFCFKRFIFDEKCSAVGTARELMFVMLDEVRNEYREHTLKCRNCLNLEIFLTPDTICDNDSLAEVLGVEKEEQFFCGEKRIWGRDMAIWDPFPDREISCKECVEDMEKCIRTIITNEKATQDEKVKRLFHHIRYCEECVTDFIEEASSINELYGDN